MIALVTLVGVWLAGSERWSHTKGRPGAAVAVLDAAERTTRSRSPVRRVAAVVLVAWDKPRPLVVYTHASQPLALWELLCLAAGRAGPHPGGTPGRPHQTDDVRFRAEHEFPGSPLEVAEILCDPAFHTRSTSPI